MQITNFEIEQEKIKDLLISIFLCKPYNLLVHKHFNELSKIKKKKNSEIWKEKKLLAPGLTLMKIFECFCPQVLKTKLNVFAVHCILFDKAIDLFSCVSLVDFKANFQYHQVKGLVYPQS